MNAKEMLEMCTDPKCDCEKCPWKDDEQSCRVVLDAIYQLRHPNWYANMHANAEKADEPNWRVNTEKSEKPNYSITDESYEWERTPKNQEYISVDFETIGNCPRCNEKVSRDIGHIQKTCPRCGLKLHWGK